MEKLNKYSKGKWVLWYFIIFFGVIASLDAFFVYMAVSTNTGVIIENAYEKGLAYNSSLKKAKTQPRWKQKVTYEDGILRWKLADENSKPLVGAVVIAHIIRPIHKGYDFDIVLKHKGGGIYEANPDIPLQGQWQAKMNGTWNNKQYQITYEFMKE